MRLNDIEGLVTQAIKTVKEREVEAMQAACEHDGRLVMSIEDATTGGGSENERIVQVRVFNCLDCNSEWSEDILWQE